MSADLERWAVVAHKDDSGFGRQACDLRAVVGLRHLFAIPSERLADKPLAGPFEHLLGPTDSDDRVRELLGGVEGIVFFERHSWHPRLLPIAREMNVRTVCVPNWEWFRGNDTQWQYCDLFVCPTQYTVGIVRRFGHKNVVYLPWALNLNGLPQRTVDGPARVFVHNAGVVDRDDRKGTRDTILAWRRVRRKDVRLIVRIQKETELPELDERIELHVGNLESAAELYQSGDICVQPSKMEGIGFMVLEPVCCGLPVITTNAAPMSEFVQQPELLVSPRWFKRRAYATQWIPHAHLRLPRIGHLARCMEWAAEHDLGRISRGNRAWAESKFAPELLREVWTRTLDRLVDGAPLLSTTLVAAEA
jgi:glycosyltransferase involved in cell wall biosynthesis